MMFKKHVTYCIAGEYRGRKKNLIIFFHLATNDGRFKSPKTNLDILNPISCQYERLIH